MRPLHHCPHCGRDLPQPAPDAPLGLTQKQAVMIDYLRAHRREHGNTAPSYGEIAAAIGLKSKSGVHRLARILEARGHVRRLAGRGRSIMVVEASP